MVPAFVNEPLHVKSTMSSGIIRNPNTEGPCVRSSATQNCLYHYKVRSTHS